MLAALPDYFCEAHAAPRGGAAGSSSSSSSASTLASATAPGPGPGPGHGLAGKDARGRAVVKGDRVRARFLGLSSRLYAGRVVSVRIGAGGETRFGVAYDDGDSEEGALPANVHRVDNESPAEGSVGADEECKEMASTGAGAMRARGCAPTGALATSAQLLSQSTEEGGEEKDAAAAPATVPYGIVSSSLDPVGAGGAANAGAGRGESIRLRRVHTCYGSWAAGLSVGAVNGGLVLGCEEGPGCEEDGCSDALARAPAPARAPRPRYACRPAWTVVACPMTGAQLSGRSRRLCQWAVQVRSDHASDWRRPAAEHLAAEHGLAAAAAEALSAGLERPPSPGLPGEAGTAAKRARLAPALGTDNIGKLDEGGGSGGGGGGGGGGGYGDDGDVEAEAGTGSEDDAGLFASFGGEGAGAQGEDDDDDDDEGKDDGDGRGDGVKDSADEGGGSSGVRGDGCGGGGGSGSGSGVFSSSFSSSSSSSSSSTGAACGGLARVARGVFAALSAGALSTASMRLMALQRSPAFAAATALGDAGRRLRAAQGRRKKGDAASLRAPALAAAAALLLPEPDARRVICSAPATGDVALGELRAFVAGVGPSVGSPTSGLGAGAEGADARPLGEAISDALLEAGWAGAGESGKADEEADADEAGGAGGRRQRLVAALSRDERLALALLFLERFGLRA